MKLKKKTIQFILYLLNQEIEAEYVQDNKDNTEIPYVMDLLRATLDFIKVYGDWYDKYSINEDLEKLNVTVENLKEES